MTPMRLLPITAVLALGLQGILVLGQAQPIHVRPGESAREIIVSLSNDVVIEGRAEQGVFTAGSSLTISGQVHGDVAVIGGKLTLQPRASIDGNVLLVGSTNEISPDATISGKLFVMPFLGQEIHEILSDPAAFLFSYRYDIRLIAPQIFFSLGWFIASILVLKLFPAHVAFACGRLKADPGYVAGMGVVGTAGLFLAGLISLALCLLLIGIPIFIFFLIFLLLAWIFGMVALFCVAGELLLRLFRIRTARPISGLIAAIIFWTLIKFLPGVSLLVHLMAFCLSMGVTLTTRFGTGTPWFRRKAVLGAPADGPMLSE